MTNEIDNLVEMIEARRAFMASVQSESFREQLRESPSLFNMTLHQMHLREWVTPSTLAEKMGKSDFITSSWFRADFEDATTPSIEVMEEALQAAVELMQESTPDLNCRIQPV